MSVRFKVLFFGFLLCFLVIFGRLFYWQVIHNRSLTLLANRQHFISQEVPGERGKIYDRENFPLVLNKQSYLLFVNPRQMKISEQQLKEKVKAVVGNDNWMVKPPFDPNLFWLPLLNNIEKKQKDQIEKEEIAGLGFEEEEKRFYPEASMSAHLLGFVGKDSAGEKKGYFGLEGYYDKELTGKPGRQKFEQDALGRPIPLSFEFEEKPVPGRDLILNIDRTVQFLVEKKLKEGVEKYGAVAGWVLVANPKTGAILAMASVPAYEPEFYFKYEQEVYRNPAISLSFEPGSIFKIIVIAAALDAKAVSSEEICDSCGGPRTIADYVIKTWNEKYYPNSSLEDIIVHSDNVGMVFVGEKLGKGRLYEYLSKFGFGEKAGIDLQGEEVPKLRAKNDWCEIDLATASFGQGIAVTPIQFLTALSAIANGGKVFQPQVVGKIKEGDRLIIRSPKEIRQVISAGAAKQVTEMMVQAVEKGEAKWTKLKGFQVAGKTGTAQIPLAGHYDPEKTIASFAGFAPASNPSFVMLVSLREPKTSPWGSETAAPLWFDIAKEIFKVWGVKPSF